MIGMSENPCAILVESVNSIWSCSDVIIYSANASCNWPPIILFMTPMFPFNMPTRQRLCRILGDEHREKNRTSHLITSVTKVFESPKHNMEIQRPAVPMSRTGLRPTWSDKRDHCMTNRASVAKNMDSWPHYWKSREGSRDAWFRTYNQTGVISDLSLIPSCDVQLTDELQWVKSRLERETLLLKTVAYLVYVRVNTLGRDWLHDLEQEQNSYLQLW